MTGDRPPLPGADWALFLDVDGTLVAIAETPEAVRVAPGLPALLAALQMRCGGALALVSGRRIADLDALFAPLQPPAAGVHGLERRRADGVTEAAACVADAVAALRGDIAAFAAANPGVRLEDKGLSLALHYRGAPDRAAAVRAFAGRLAGGAGDALRLLEGKMVVEFQPRHADKGVAIAAFMAEPPFRGRHPAFAGDDVTDEDGFRAVERLGGTTVKVGAGASGARWRLPSVAAVHAWLRAGLDAIASSGDGTAIHGTPLSLWVDRG